MSAERDSISMHEFKLNMIPAGAKILVVGLSRTGKTTFIKSFLKGFGRPFQVAGNASEYESVPNRVTNAADVIVCEDDAAIPASHVLKEHASKTVVYVTQYVTPCFPVFDYVVLFEPCAKTMELPHFSSTELRACFTQLDRYESLVVNWRDIYYCRKVSWDFSADTSPDTQNGNPWWKLFCCW